MKTRFLAFAFVAPLLLSAGCDNITGLDNRDPPTSQFTGRVVYAAAAGAALAGKPVGVRSSEVRLELWEPSYFAKYGQQTAIEVRLAQDGTFAAVLFDGQYKFNQVANGGPWLTTSDTILVNVNGSTVQDFPVTPHYTILTESFTRTAATTAKPGGSVTATFTVGKVNTTRTMELVGVYVGTTQFVDRTNTIAGVTGPQKERANTAAGVLTQFTAGSPITITYDLPNNIYESGSAVRRDVIFIRIGVKSTGLTPLLYSPVYEMNLDSGAVKLVGT